jgi:hypothetical protein
VRLTHCLSPTTLPWLLPLSLTRPRSKRKDICGVWWCLLLFYLGNCVRMGKKLCMARAGILMSIGNETKKDIVWSIPHLCIWRYLWWTVPSQCDRLSACSAYKWTSASSTFALSDLYKTPVNIESMCHMILVYVKEWHEGWLWISMQWHMFCSIYR